VFELMRELIKKTPLDNNKGVFFPTMGVLKDTVLFRLRFKQRRSEEIYLLNSTTNTKAKTDATISEHT
jgi:hypothetical protein